MTRALYKSLLLKEIRVMLLQSAGHVHVIQSSAFWSEGSAVVFSGGEGKLQVRRLAGEGGPPWKIVSHVPAGAGVSVEAVGRAKMEISHRNALTTLPRRKGGVAKMSSSARPRPHSGTASTNPETRRPSPFHAAATLHKLEPIFIFMGGPTGPSPLRMT